MASAGGPKPLCVGIESGQATGWTYTDWVEDMVLRQHGAAVYDQWVLHEIPFNDPRIVESMDTVLQLWTEDNVTFDGRFTKLDGVTLQPKPLQSGGPPLWIAGRSRAAIRRAGRLGDGYLPYLFSPDRYRDSLAQVRQGAEEAGRDPAAIEPGLYQFICLADSYEEAKRIAAADLSRRYNQPFESIVDRYVVMGTAEDCARRLADFAEAGARHFLLVPITPGLADFIRHVERYAAEIIPRFRQPQQT